MTELDPAIWENKTLGAAAPNENLDRLERQRIEDRAAKFEDREPREIVVDNTYPGWTPEVNERTGTVPSNYQTVHFADEKPNDIPVDSGRPEEDASTVQVPEEETHPENADDNSTGPEQQNNSEPNGSDSSTEGNETVPDSETAESGVGAPHRESGETGNPPAPESESTEWR